MPPHIGCRRRALSVPPPPSGAVELSFVAMVSHQSSASAYSSCNDSGNPRTLLRWIVARRVSSASASFDSSVLGLVVGFSLQPALGLRNVLGSISLVRIRGFGFEAPGSCNVILEQLFVRTGLSEWLFYPAASIFSQVLGSCITFNEQFQATSIFSQIGLNLWLALACSCASSHIHIPRAVGRLLKDLGMSFC